MSTLRKELIKGQPGDPCPKNGTAYYMILSAVRTQHGLAHGKIRDAHGEFCAVGSYFEINKGALPTALIDEVAAVNDSVPHMTPRQRRFHVMRWLRWKLAQAGMPGYSQSAKAK